MHGHCHPATLTFANLLNASLKSIKCAQFALFVTIMSDMGIRFERFVFAAFFTSLPLPTSPGEFIKILKWKIFIYCDYECVSFHANHCWLLVCISHLLVYKYGSVKSLDFYRQTKFVCAVIWFNKVNLRLLLSPVPR